MQLPLWLVILLSLLLVLGALGWVMLMRRGSVRTVTGVANEPELPSKIEAIKRYREQHKVSLKEAKDAVEAQLSGASQASEPPNARARTKP